MPQISEETLRDAVNSIVRPIANRGELHTITHKLVRQKIEEELGLEGGAADDPQYKRIIREATVKLIEEASGDGEGEEEPEKEPPKPKKPNKKATSASTSKRKRSPSPAADATPSPPRKAARSKKSHKPAISEEEHAEEPEEGYQEDDSKPKKGKIKAAPKAKPEPKRRKSKAKAASEDEDDKDMDVDEEPKAKRKAPKVKAQKPTNSTLYKTPEHVPTSDVEQDEPTAAPSPKRRSPAKLKPKKSSPKKTARNSAALVISEAEDGNTETEKAKAKAPSPKKGPPTKPTENGDDSETGLSDLIDEPPKKRQSKVKDEKAKEPSTKRRASASKPGLSKDEEQIKKLKSLVLACGVRKVWSKLFKDLDSCQQISKLKELLAGLGMTGRLSLEKAKEIKAKREFQQELEDVKEFAKSMEQRGARRARKPAQEIAESEEEKAEESEEEEEDVAPRRRFGNARNSIAAFLQDQSDSD